MKTYTVIMMDDNTGEVLQCVQEAENDFAAMAQTAKECLAKGDDGIVIIGAIEGDVTLQPPGECSGTSAFVSDMVELVEA